VLHVLESSQDFYQLLIFGKCFFQDRILRELAHLKSHKEKHFRRTTSGFFPPEFRLESKKLRKFTQFEKCATSKPPEKICSDGGRKIVLFADNSSKYALTGLLVARIDFEKL